MWFLIFTAIVLAVVIIAVPPIKRKREERNSPDPILSFDSFLKFYNVAPDKWKLFGNCVRYNFLRNIDDCKAVGYCGNCSKIPTCKEMCFKVYSRYVENQHCDYFFNKKDTKRYYKWLQEKTKAEQDIEKCEDLKRLTEAVKEDIQNHREQILKDAELNINEIFERMKEERGIK